MVNSSDASVDEQLERSLQLVATQAAHMLKTLQSPQGKLLAAIKQVTTMLGELMTSKLPPRSYYELYNSCFDALSQLQAFLIEDHKRHHLADVYTIVQYVSNVLPRLYLMITVGTAFLATGDAPKTEVLKDLLEMSRGVQNPLRGLFLRYYLGQRTGEFLSGNNHEDTQFSVQFTLTNFIEMNKLWVRYQHQGHSRDYERRLKERVQLQTIVGSSILRLSQLDAVGIRTFSEQILPAVLDQTVQCRDKLAQEYLLDIIVQAFPAEFHLETLEVFLQCFEFLNPDTSVSTIMLASMNRIISYARAKRIDIESSKATVAAAEQLQISQSEEPEEPEDETKEEPKEESEDETMGEHEDETKDEPKETPKETPEQGTPEPETSEKKTPEEGAEPETSEPNKDASSEPVETPREPVFDESTALSNVLQEIASLYWQKMRALKLDIAQRASLVRSLIELLQVADSALPLSDLFGFVIGDSIQESEQVEGLLFSLFETNQDLAEIIGLLKTFPTLLSSQSKRTRHGMAERVINQLLNSAQNLGDMSQTRQVLELFSTLLRSGGFDTSKLAQFIRLIRGESEDSTLELLQMAHKTMREGGQAVVQKTSAVIANRALLLLWENQGPEGGQPDAAVVAQILKFVNRIAHDLSTVGNAPFAAYRLFLSAGEAADVSGAEEIAYELFAQAFTTYEELIIDSHQQVVALSIAIQKLQRTSVFTSENYEPLAQRCIQFAQRLLKKPEQCRALIQASHLYWDNEYSDARRVEETLSRALRSADSVMDTLVSIELFLDVLDINLYFLANDTTTVTVGSVNSVLKLVKDNIESAKKEGLGESRQIQQPQQPSQQQTVVPLTELESRLNRISQFVHSQIADFPRFEGLEI